MRINAKIKDYFHYLAKADNPNENLVWNVQQHLSNEIEQRISAFFIDKSPLKKLLDPISSFSYW